MATITAHVRLHPFPQADPARHAILAPVPTPDGLAPPSPIPWTPMSGAGSGGRAGAQPSKRMAMQESGVSRGRMHGHV